MGEHGCYGYGTRYAIPILKHSGEASSSPFWKRWKAAMEAGIYENLKIGVGLIEKSREAARGHTWLNTTVGNTVFKARLTARGDQEDPANINNDHRSSPTADQDSIRIILAELANMSGANLMSFDFVRAYLQARMPKDVKPILIRVPARF
jgi:hypothetical protein